MSLRAGIQQLRATLDRYAGVEQTLTDIEADVVTACRQIVEAAGDTPKRSATVYHEFRTPVSGPMDPRKGITISLSADNDAPGGSEARKRGQGADSPSSARRAASSPPRYATGKKKWTVPPAKAKAPRDTSPAPESTHAAEIARIEKKLGRALGPREALAAEAFLDGNSISEVAATMSISYASAYTYAYRFGLNGIVQGKRAVRSRTKKTPAPEESDDA